MLWTSGAWDSHTAVRGLSLLRTWEEGGSERTMEVATILAVPVATKKITNLTKDNANNINNA